MDIFAYFALTALPCYESAFIGCARTKDASQNLKIRQVGSIFLFFFFKLNSQWLNAYKFHQVSADYFKTCETHSRLVDYGTYLGEM